MRIKSKKKYLNNSVIIFGSLVCVLILHYIGLTKGAESAIIYLLKPIKRVFYVADLQVEKTLNSFFSDEKSELDLLNDEVIQLKVQLAKCNELENENKILREQLNINRERNYNLIEAKVIGKNPDSFSYNLLIDVGRNDGVEINMPVILQEALVGKIVFAEENMSEVMLITDANSHVPAFVQSNNVKGLVEGTLGSGLLLMTQLDNEQQYEIGDFVLTTGLELRNHPNILIGQIGEIISNNRDTYKTAKIIPTVDLDYLDTVFVLTD